VVSGDVYDDDNQFSVDKIFTNNKEEPNFGSYWLGNNRETATFVLNLGCQFYFDRIQLVNTHNTKHRDRSTKKFRYYHT
jgi:hypothetical protein